MVDKLSEDLKANEEGQEVRGIPQDFAASAVARALVRGDDGVLYSPSVVLVVLLTGGCGIELGEQF